MQSMCSCCWSLCLKDNKVNGTTRTTRCVGNSYLHPHVIADPYTATVALRHDDEFVIIANRGLWRSVTALHDSTRGRVSGHSEVRRRSMSVWLQVCVVRRGGGGGL